MLATARIQSRPAGDALTYICLDAPLWGTHDVAVWCCSSVAPDVRIWGSLPAGEFECEREVQKPVAGLSIAGEGRVCWHGVIALLATQVRSLVLRL
jgi:hypothetical protein